MFQRTISPLSSWLNISIMMRATWPCTPEATVLTTPL
jgi:hypothetical protein